MIKTNRQKLVGLLLEQVREMREETSKEVMVERYGEKTDAEICELWVSNALKGSGGRGLGIGLGFAMSQLGIVNCTVNELKAFLNE